MATKKKTTKKCEQCKCADCKCERSQVPFYILIAILAAISTILIISLSFNKSVRDLFRPSTYVYNGKFADEKTNNIVDVNGIKQLSAGAVIDMLNTNQDGLLLVGESNCLGCDAFARRVVKYGVNNVYRYTFDSEGDTIDDNRAKERLQGCDDTPVFFYIRNGAVFDRLDDVKDEAGLAAFMAKYYEAE